MLVGKLVDHVCIAYICKGPGAAYHAQVLKAVFCQHIQFRRLPFGKVRLQTHDATVKDCVRAEFDREGLAEIQDLAVKVEKVQPVIHIAQVAEEGLAAIQPIRVFSNQQAPQSFRNRWHVLPCN